MSRTLKYYKLTEWPLVKRWLLISLIAVVSLFLLWLFINLQWQFCPGMEKDKCNKVPKHSLRNLL